MNALAHATAEAREALKTSASDPETLAFHVKRLEKAQQESSSFYHRILTPAMRQSKQHYPPRAAEEDQANAALWNDANLVMSLLRGRARRGAG